MGSFFWKFRVGDRGFRRSQTAATRGDALFVMLMPIRITLRVATWALHGRVSSDSASK
jgi:hypothetical protein